MSLHFAHLKYPFGRILNRTFPIALQSKDRDWWWWQAELNIHFLKSLFVLVWLNINQPPPPSPLLPSTANLHTICTIGMILYDWYLSKEDMIIHYLPLWGAQSYAERFFPLLCTGKRSRKLSLAFQNQMWEMLTKGTEFYLCSVNKF